MRRELFIVLFAVSLAACSGQQDRQSTDKELEATSHVSESKYARLLTLYPLIDSTSFTVLSDYNYKDSTKNGVRLDSLAFLGLASHKGVDPGRFNEGFYAIGKLKIAGSRIR